MMRAAALSMRCSGSVLRGALSVRTPHPWPRSLRRVHAAAATCDALGSSGEKKELPPLPKEASVVVVGGGVIGASVGYHLRFAARLFDHCAVGNECLTQGSARLLPRVTRSYARQ